jgi:hypothetical protein
LSYEKGSVAVTEKSDREELERRLEQSRRMLREHDDPLTKERLTQSILDLEEQLR